MLVQAAMAYLHYLSILLTGMFLAYELILLRPELGPREARLLGRIDRLYFGSALGILATGLLRVFWFAKGPEYYLANPVFYAKFGLFVVVALLSLPPTLTFLRWRPALAAGQAPVLSAAEMRRLRRFLHAELGLFLLIPLLAALMARGIGN
jgi:putative membrane protein